MKTLKFMLAAATAIGLASASQAAGPYDGSTDFESDTLNTSITTSGDYWTVPSGAEEGDYTFVSGVPDSNLRSPGAVSKFTATPAQVLQLEGGVDPLTRNIKATGAAVNLTEGDVYIDTLVKFTVTPAGDDVTASGSDKLMVYLKEMTNGVGVVSGTNLVVKTCNFTAALVPGMDDTLEVLDVDTGVSVDPNTWYRLTVKASAKDLLDGRYLPVFTVKVGANELDAGAGLANGDANTKLFPSILGAVASPTIASVGFAGSGAVDDLLFTTWDPMVSVVDFYLVVAGDGAGLSGNATYSNAVGNAALNFGTNTVQYLSTDPSVTVTATAAAGYTATWDNDPNGATLTPGAYYTLTVAGLFPRTNTAGQDGTPAHPYEVATAADVKVLQEAVNCGVYADKCFVLTGNIDMTGVEGFWGIGWFTSSDSKDASITASGDHPFTGVFDGAGYTISNVTIVRHNYAGVFNNVSGTVKNLTVQNIGFSGTCSEWGCAIVGNAAAGSLLSNLTAAASTVWGDNANHNVAGIVVRPIGTATIYGCVNNANITASGKRVGGIAAFVGSGSTGTVFDSCTNNAAIVSSNGTRGVGGILGCAEGNTAETATYIRNCADFGSETAQAEGGHAGAIVGSNWNGSYTYTDDGGNTFKASTVDCGYIKNQIFGRTYSVASTIDGTACLTTVKQADLAAGNTYTLLTNVVAGTVFTLQNAGDTIAFDNNGYTDAGTVDAAAGLTASSATSGNVKTWTAANTAYAIVYLNDDGTPFTDWAANYTAPTSYTVADAVTLPTSSDVDLQVVGVSFGGWTNETGTVTGWDAGEKSGAQTFYVKLDAVVAPAGWVDDSSTVSNQTAATAYPDLVGNALATADAQELTDWAKKNSIAFADVAADTEGAYTEAFLLNCAVADVATEKAAFKANISVAADGTVTVTTPDGKDYNGTLQLKGKAALTDATWTNVEAPSSSYKFYMYELSL